MQRGARSFLPPTVVLGLVLALAAPAAGAGFAAGTKQLGGQATMSYERTAATVAATGWSLSVAPGFGYFIRDGLELRVGLGFDLRLGLLYSAAPISLSFDAGLRYFLDIGCRFAPYAGVAFGPAFTIPNAGGASTTLAVSVPLGIVVPVNDSVAFDVGTRFEYARVVQNGTGSTLKIPLGYLGVQAFFP